MAKGIRIEIRLSDCEYRDDGGYAITGNVLMTAKNLPKVILEDFKGGPTELLSVEAHALVDEMVRFIRKADEKELPDVNKG